MDQLFAALPVLSMRSTAATPRRAARVRDKRSQSLTRWRKRLAPPKEAPHAATRQPHQAAFVGRGSRDGAIRASAASSDGGSGAALGVATGEGGDGFDSRRVREPISPAPIAEATARAWAQAEVQALAVPPTPNRLQENPARFSLLSGGGVVTARGGDSRGDSGRSGP